MLFAHIDVLDENWNYRQDQYVAVSGDRIVAISNHRPNEDYETEYNGRGKLMMPGLYNCHTHSPMTLLRGFGENMSLMDWLGRVQPVEDTFTSEDLILGAQIAAAEMLRSGTISVTEMYLQMDVLCRTFGEIGMKANISRGIIGFDNTPLPLIPEFDEIEKAIKQYHRSYNGRIQTDISLHAEYTSTPSLVEETAAYAREKELRMHIHLSESQGEHEACKEKWGKTPAAYFESLGVFDIPATAAHCVWLEEEDRHILKTHGVTVASCPFSNLKLASGICNIPALLDEGINITAGTDGAASNNSLNLFHEAKLFATLSKGYYKDPTVITPTQVLNTLTVNGAKSQGRADCGALAAGKKADLIVLDLSHPTMQPAYDVKNNLVFSGSGEAICLTMVDGKVLYQDGEYLTLDIEKIQYESAKWLEKLRTFYC